MTGRVRKFRFTGERHVKMRPDDRTRGARENSRRRTNGMLATANAVPVYIGTYNGL